MQDQDENENENAIVISKNGIPLLLAILASSGLGLGGYGAWQAQQVADVPSARADPWTGKMAREQAAALRNEMRELYRSQVAVYDRMERRVDELEQCKAVVYSRLETIILSIARLEAAMDRD